MKNRCETNGIAKARKRNLFLSILICVVCGLALLMSMRGGGYEAYSFEVAKQWDLETLRSVYVETDKNEDLYRYVLALCREAYLEGEAFDASELCECGRELYRRAKLGNLDLERIGDPDDTTAMLSLLKEYNITPSES